MIDRDGRHAVAELLRHLVSGQVTNDQFEDRLPWQSLDRGVRQVSEEAWCLYSDLWEHRLVGSERLGEEARRHVSRWILFLQSELEYEWPAWSFGARFLASLTRLVTLGFYGHRARRHYEGAGDISVWPFLRRTDYDRAVANPRYLSGAVQQPDAAGGAR
jgi:hypothetical protein